MNRFPPQPAEDWSDYSSDVCLELELITKDDNSDAERGVSLHLSGFRGYAEYSTVRKGVNRSAQTGCRSGLSARAYCQSERPKGVAERCTPGDSAGPQLLLPDVCTPDLKVSTEVEDDEWRPTWKDNCPHNDGRVLLYGGATDGAIDRWGWAPPGKTTQQRVERESRQIAAQITKQDNPIYADVRSSYPAGLAGTFTWTSMHMGLVWKQRALGGSSSSATGGEPTTLVHHLQRRGGSITHFALVRGYS